MDLKSHCIKCHGEKNMESGVRLDQVNYKQSNFSRKIVSLSTDLTSL